MSHATFWRSQSWLDPQHHKSTLNGYLAEFTGKPLDTVMEDTDRDFFMSAFEAKDYGLIDSVIEHPTDIAVRSSGIPMYAGELWLGSKL